VFGTPSAVMYSSDVVRRGRALTEDRFYNDTDEAFQILGGSRDFGFVHHVLSFTATAGSITNNEA